MKQDMIESHVHMTVIGVQFQPYYLRFRSLINMMDSLIPGKCKLSLEFVLLFYTRAIWSVSAFCWQIHA